eukprot:1407858-Karenia_brevis.AAC.1
MFKLSSLFEPSPKIEKHHRHHHHHRPRETSRANRGGGSNVIMMTGVTNINDFGLHPEMVYNRLKWSAAFSGNSWLLAARAAQLHIGRLEDIHLTLWTSAKESGGLASTGFPA